MLALLHVGSVKNSQLPAYFTSSVWQMNAAPGFGVGKDDFAKSEQKWSKAAPASPLEHTVIFHANRVVCSYP
jgi:hypothetical protein